ncbi:hypothetical protein CO046_02740 [Candidatus Peregrinibacteria bacterium CG_4_9_14_0_2_um_filter_53_11]|nr:MAG: hypothetical protein CO046_02740 [Candidatus Peregrinibacteria bacterium CG_4_9_14_0_2_um_filter_53_11]
MNPAASLTLHHRPMSQQKNNSGTQSGSATMEDVTPPPEPMEVVRSDEEENSSQDSAEAVKEQVEEPSLGQVEEEEEAAREDAQMEEDVLAAIGEGDDQEEAEDAEISAEEMAGDDDSHEPSEEEIKLEKTYRSLVEGLRAFCQKNNFKRAVIGLSGGIDSSLTLKIAVDALGGDNVTGLIMPELGVTRQENIDHAKMLAEFFGARYLYQPINTFVGDFGLAPWKPSRLATMNTKARVRAVLLYSFANTEHTLVLGTSNKSELLLGYGTKYGDLASDIEVIGALLKTEIFALGEYVGLPPEIVKKAPSAELSAGQTDEAEMGANYYELDKVLSKIELGKDACVAHGLPIALVQLVFRRYEENLHKNTMPPIIEV